MYHRKTQTPRKFISADELLKRADRGRQNRDPEVAAPLVQILDDGGLHHYVNPRYRKKQKEAAAAAAQANSASRHDHRTPPAYSTLEMVEIPAEKTVAAIPVLDAHPIRQRLASPCFCDSFGDAVRAGAISTINGIARLPKPEAEDRKMGLWLPMCYCPFDGNAIGDSKIALRPWDWTNPPGSAPACCVAMNRAILTGNIVFRKGSLLGLFVGTNGNEPFIWCPWCRTEAFRVNQARTAWRDKQS